MGWLATAATAAWCLCACDAGGEERAAHEPEPTSTEGPVAEPRAPEAAAIPSSALAPVRQPEPESAPSGPPEEGLTSTPQNGAWRAVDGDLPAVTGVLRRLREVPVVFAGRLIAVGEPPSFWSGRVVATQSLTYRVERAFAGVAPGERLTVHQTIVSGSPAARPDRPELVSALTRVGESYLVLAREPRGGRRLTAVPPSEATDALLSRVEAAMHGGATPTE